MREGIIILLALILMAMWGIEEAVKEGNLPEAEKVQIFEQNKMKKQAEEYMEKERLARSKLMLNQSWNETNEKDIVEWVVINAIDNIWVRLLFTAFFIISFGMFYIKKQTHHN